MLLLVFYAYSLKPLEKVPRYVCFAAQNICQKRLFSSIHFFLIILWILWKKKIQLIFFLHGNDVKKDDPCRWIYFFKLLQGRAFATAWFFWYFFTFQVKILSINTLDPNWSFSYTSSQQRHQNRSINFPNFYNCNSQLTLLATRFLRIYPHDSITAESLSD